MTSSVDDGEDGGGGGDVRRLVIPEQVWEQFVEQADKRGVDVTAWLTTAGRTQVSRERAAETIAYLAEPDIAKKVDTWFRDDDTDLDVDIDEETMARIEQRVQKALSEPPSAVATRAPRPGQRPAGGKGRRRGK